MSPPGSNGGDSRPWLALGLLLLAIVIWGLLPVERLDDFWLADVGWSIFLIAMLGLAGAGAALMLGWWLWDLSR